MTQQEFDHIENEKLQIALLLSIRLERAGAHKPAVMVLRIASDLFIQARELRRVYERLLQ